MVNSPTIKTSNNTFMLAFNQAQQQKKAKNNNNIQMDNVEDVNNKKDNTRDLTSGSFKESDTESENWSDVEAPMPMATNVFNGVALLRMAKLRSLATTWKKKAKVSGFNSAFTGEGEVNTTHSLYHTKRRSIPLKNYHDEARAMKDIEKFIENPVVLFKIHKGSWDAMVKEMLLKLKEVKPELKFNTDKVAATIVDQEADYLIPEVIQGITRRSADASVTEQSFVVVLGSIPTLEETQVVMAFSENPFNLGPRSEEVRYICLILSPSKGKTTKSGIEVGRTYSTLLADETLRHNLLRTHSAADFATQFEKEVHRILKKHTEDIQKEKEKSHITVKQKEQEIKDKKKNWFIPGKDIWDDVKRRAPHYLSDYKEGLTECNGIMKIISATLFLYFSLLLPGIAFGVLQDKYTDGKIDTKSVIQAQALGGLIFSIFGGQPLLVLRTTIPIVIYTKVIYVISKEFDIEGAEDGDFFRTFYAMCGLFNAMFLFIYALTGASKIMMYCSRSTEEIVGIFISLAWVIEALTYLTTSFKQFCFDEVTNSTIHKRAAVEAVTCEPTIPMLALILMAGTVFIGVTIYEFKHSPYLTAAKRMYVADYAIAVSVLIMSFIGSYFFKGIKMETFKISDRSLFQLDAMKTPNIASVFASMGLGFIVSLLFFIEGNIAAAVVNDPQNRLKKGPAFHLDIFVTGFINAIMSIFGLPWIHGAEPHSPLHVRALADIEKHVDQGHATERIMYVRETRITTLIAHIMIGLSLLMLPHPLDLIPLPVLYGLFLFLAVTSLEEFHLWERFLLLFTDQNLYPPIHYIRKVPQKWVHLFTLLQLLQLGVICALCFTGNSYAKMFFPLVIIVMLPIRLKLIPKIIQERYLDILDGHH